MNVSLTFVSISVGEFSKQESIRSIGCLNEYCKLVQIENVFPQAKALNLMIDLVDTEFFVPLDADMVLYSNGFDRIQNAIKKNYHRNDWYSILFKLKDTLTDKEILALKILRTKVLKSNKFIDNPTPDVNHFKSLEDKRHVCITDYLKTRPIGEHRVIGNKFCYAKYKDVYQTYKYHNFVWDNQLFMGGETLQEKAKCHFDFFIGKWVETNNDDYLACISGMMDGILSETDKSKTYENFRFTYPVKDATAIFLNWYYGQTHSLEADYLLF